MIDLSMREGGIVESLADLPIRLDCLGKLVQNAEAEGIQISARLLVIDGRDEQGVGLTRKTCPELKSGRVCSTCLKGGW